LGGAYLNGANLGGANLSAAHLSGAELIGTKLSGANLREANLFAAKLRGADLRAAILRGANLRAADLLEADLNGVDLRWTHLGRANLVAANLLGVRMWGTTLTEIDLSTVKGLETVRHDGPSSIGLDTIYLSKGNIPHVFLRGAGVPDNFIEYMSSLTGKAFEYYSCFISYSTKDQGFAERLFADLQTKGVRCWFAPHHIQGGKKLHEQIDTAIRMHERLLLILSPDSINSEWVKTEIAKARQREVRDKTRVLFPVRMGISFDQLRDWEYFDADIGKDSAREIREYYIPDFSQWKSHDSYQEEFAKLLRDLTKA
jgi:hypothetical protein